MRWLWATLTISLCRAASEDAVSRAHVLLAAGHIQEAAAVASASIRAGRAVSAQGELSAHHVLGHAHYHQGNFLAAAEAFRYSLAAHPGVASEWGNLGNALKQGHDMEAAVDALEAAVAHSSDVAWHGGLINLQLWTGRWRGLGALSAALHSARTSASATEVLDMPLSRIVAGTVLAAKRARGTLAPATGGCAPTPHSPLHVAFIGSDWGQHPVPELLAAALLHLPTHAEVTVVTLRPPSTPAMVQLLRRVGHLEASGVPAREVASALQGLGVDVAVDLGGHTGGALPLRLVSYGVAPLQLSFLGYPGTTAAPWMHGLVMDSATLPAEAAGVASERLALLPRPYLPSSHPYMHPHTPRQQPRSLRTAVLLGKVHISCPSAASYLLGVVSGQQKITPSTLAVWAALLRDTPCAAVQLHPSAAAGRFIPARMRRVAASLGLAPWRLGWARRSRPSAHLAPKAAYDLVLDTPLKTGHASALDALWAGAPLVTLAGSLPHQRAAASVCRGLGGGCLLPLSLRGYAATCEEVLGDGGMLLSTLRDQVAAARGSPVWDSAGYAADFAALLAAAHQARAVGLGGRSVPSGAQAGSKADMLSQWKGWAPPPMPHVLALAPELAAAAAAALQH